MTPAFGRVDRQGIDADRIGPKRGGARGLARRASDQSMAGGARVARRAPRPRYLTGRRLRIPYGRARCPRGGMVDTGDLKSLGLWAVPVRVRPRVPRCFCTAKATAASHHRKRQSFCKNDESLPGYKPRPWPHVTLSSGFSIPNTHPPEACVGASGGDIFETKKSRAAPYCRRAALKAMACWYTVAAFHSFKTRKLVVPS